MDTNLKGNIGEAKALWYFVKEGYEVYLPFGTASKCDMIVSKDNKTFRVSVKTTSRKSKSGKNYLVKIKQGKLNSQVHFNNEDSDLLFVYLIPEDKYIIFESKNITQKSEITIHL